MVQAGNLQVLDRVPPLSVGIPRLPAFADGDHAVGVAYAIASRASNEIAAGLIRVTDTFGGAKDIHGGIGANGALRLKPGEGSAQTLTGASIPALNPGVNNLKCDFIKGHNDIRTPEVGRLLVAAVE